MVENHGAHHLKGIAEPVELYRIARLSGARSRLAASAVRGLTPFVGRADEIGLLWDCWERARDGEGQVVFIVGEAGIGKSRLVRQFRERLAGAPHTWNECVGASYFQNTPFYPIGLDTSSTATFVDSLRRCAKQKFLSGALALLGYKVLMDFGEAIGPGQDRQKLLLATLLMRRGSSGRHLLPV